MKKIVIAFLVALVVAPVAAHAVDPIAVDSRVRTLVYNRNEVFTIPSKYGYQMSIELAQGEKIQTISMGDPVAFKLTPVSERIFIKALQKDMQTNMTLITNFRTYQFDLTSKVNHDDDVVYVVRFFYPQDAIDAIDPISGVVPEQIMPSMNVVGRGNNYNYTLAGPDAIAPRKVFDNGRSTFFKFPDEVEPFVNGINPDGTEYPLEVQREGEYIVVDAILSTFAVRFGADVVCVFNEGR